MSGELRVSIPNSVRKTIQNIKEIAGNHSDEEVYAMLRECGMDPNETAQRLLLEDTFHVVKGKRYKRKENIGSKELPDAGWRIAGQGRGGRGSKGSYSSRFIPNDSGSVRSLPVGKDMGTNHGADKGAKDKGAKTTYAIQDAESKSPPPPPPTKPNYAPAVTNGDVKLTCPEGGHSSETSQSENTSLNSDVNCEQAVLIGDALRKSILSAKLSSSSTHPMLGNGVSATACNRECAPSLDKGILYAGEITKYDAGTQQGDVEPNAKIGSHDITSAVLLSSAETIASIPDTSQLLGKVSSRSQKDEVNHLPQVLQAATAPSVTISSESRPSSNYSDRSQSLIGQPKGLAGHSKEWKPKQLKPDHVKNFESTGASQLPSNTAEIVSLSPPSLTANVLETSKIQKKLGDVQFSDRRHVIFPNHIRVPEADRAGLSFGSFDANFGQKISSEKDAEGGKDSAAESDHDAEDAKDSPYSSQDAAIEVEEVGTSDHPESPQQMSEALSSDAVGIPSSISIEREFDQPKPENIVMPGSTSSQYSVVQTVPAYSTFGLVAPAFAGQITTFENPESQAHDASHLSGIVVQPPIDISTGYYTQLYHANADSDGRVSPVVVPGAIPKYNGHSTILSNVDQASQENGHSPGQSTSGPASVGNQGAGVMQTSAAAVQQQAVSGFRQPTGLHISHYPPNFIPYNQYFSPFYLPPPNMHSFLSNPAFPQQHPAGSIYPPAPMAPAAAPIKFPISQFKAGGNNVNAAHSGSTGFGLNTSSLNNYNSTSATNVMNSTGNEDLVAPQYKENVYVAGQQNEGPALWFQAPGRDMSGLQASSFYNISPQGQHFVFTPMQAGHPGFPGIYHPTQAATPAAMHPLLQQSQAVAGGVEMVAPPTGVFQQPQRTQVNWANNY